MDLSSLARFHIAPGYDPSQPETWVWEDRSADVQHTSRPAVRIGGGRGDEVSQIEAGSAALVVDNAGGHYCTQNPLGRWHGKLALGCPARWGTISGAEAWSANTSNGWGTPDVGMSWSLEGSAANWSSSGGVGLWSASAANVQAAAELVGANARNGNATWVCSTPVIPTGSSLYFSLAARRTDANSMLMFHVEFGAGGALTARIRRQHGGILSNLASASMGSYTAGQRIKAEAEWDGQDLRLRVWPEAGTKPAAWSVTTTDNQCTGSIVALHSLRPVGNTNVGAIAFSYDDLEVLAIEIVGTVPKWPVRWDPTAQESWAPIEIAGVTRRLGQGAAAVRSPMYRQISPYTTLIGYWPLEDGGKSTQTLNVVPRGIPGSAVGMNFGAEGPDGSAGAVTFANNSPASQLLGTFKPASTTAGWQISWSAKLSVPAGPNNLMTWYTSNGYTWQLGIDVGSFTILVTNAAGSTVLSSSVSYVGAAQPDQWITYRLKATASGGNVTAEFAWFQQGAPTVWGVTWGPFAGTVGALRTWASNGNTIKQGSSLCHVFAVTTGLDNLQSAAATRAFDGYAGELAAVRIARLCGESSVPALIEAGDSEPLGPQRKGTLLELLRAAEAADMGVLYEAGAGIGYQPRAGRYNRPVGMTLSMSQDGDVADPPPEPADDDLQVRNEWTVARDGGSESTADDPDHVALNGHRPDSVTINIDDDARLIQHAQWRVHMGTWGEMRWPQITLMLTDRPALLAAWRGRPFGLRITISGVPAQGPIGADLDLVVEGWSQEIDSDGWKVVLNCTPAGPWQVGVYDVSRCDTPSATLAEDLTTAETLWDITADELDHCFSRTSLPYDVMVGGERCTVTAASLRAGSGPYTQTLTCTRSVNGIVKTHDAGERIRIATPGRLAL